MCGRLLPSNIRTRSQSNFPVEVHVKRFLLTAACLLALGAQAKVSVIATISDLGALAREAGGEHVSVQVISKPTQDPHFVDARPNLIIQMSNAELLIHAGMDLEAGWLPTLLSSSRNGKIQVGSPGNLNGATLIRPLEVPQQKIERAMGDIHPGGNPHYTKDPRNALLLVKGIANRLAELDPEHAEAYQANAARFEKSIAAKEAEWLAALAPYKGQPIITFHRSWSYFANWSGLEVVAFLEPKPGLPPALAHVADVTMIARQKKVKLVLQESWYSAQFSRYVAEKSGARVVQVMGQTPEGQSYEAYMSGLVAEVVKALSGT